MCGLVGVFSKAPNGFTQHSQNAFTTLMAIDALRGEDSTGAFLVHLNGSCTIMKEASHAGTFLQSKEYEDFMKKAWDSGACAIGHNRKATKGSIKDENAHPFYVNDKIVLVHNGTMFGDHKEHANVEVDSNAIAHLIHDKPTVEEALGSFYGPYALMWYDVDKEEVNIIRNADRPLWWMETAGAYIWSSERCMLDFVSARVGIAAKEQPSMLPANVLNTFSLKKGRWEISDRKAEPKRPTYGAAARPAGRAVDPLDDDEEAMNAMWGGWGRLPPPTVNATVAPSGDVDTVVHTMSMGGQTWDKTSPFEKDLAKRTNKLVSMKEFTSQIVDMYKTGESIKCQAFEYAPAGENGWFLYLSPVEDPNVIMRHHFPASLKVSEERILTMAMNEWVFECKIGTKAWSELLESEKDQGAHQVGYCVVKSGGVIKLLKGGGVRMEEMADAK